MMKMIFVVCLFCCFVLIRIYDGWMFLLFFFFISKKKKTQLQKKLGVVNNFPLVVEKNMKQNYGAKNTTNRSLAN